MTDEIKKPWGVYSRGSFSGICGLGKIVKEDEKTAEIKYSEKGYSEPWDIKYIKRFDSLEETIEYYIQNRPETDTRWGRDSTKKEIELRMKENFPAYFKNKKKFSYKK